MRDAIEKYSASLTIFWQTPYHIHGSVELLFCCHLSIIISSTALTDVIVSFESRDDNKCAYHIITWSESRLNCLDEQRSRTLPTIDCC